MIWTASAFARSDRYWSPLAVAGGRVFVTGSDDRLRALDAASGAQVWSAPLEELGPTLRPLGPLVVGDNVIGLGRHLTAFDSTTGTPRWHTDDISGLAGLAVTAEPATVYTARGLSDHLAALDAATGSVRWTVPLRAEAFAAGAGVVAAIEARALVVVDAVTGTPRWRAETKAVPLNVHVCGDLVIALGYSDAEAFDLATGARLWARDDIQGDFATATGDSVFLGGNSKRSGVVGSPTAVHALDRRTGRTRWKCSATPAPPVVADGQVYVVSARMLQALDAATGALRGQCEIGSVESTVTIVDRTAYVYGGDGQVYAVAV
ncbi:Outer membrane protein assembly factor BamB, contains PQQ-like beta-propeller repeat [Nocardia amikacinitolerans]|uniref:outer membrane protein assembly factor BamB family protein n=1 Tax=Nocardia amikacinitolerans TaxID=756689 RepID=UPI000AA92293|nr:PQQ-binding-like beta-propeller repeat protein [Nocardia amikacinitolerans]MCP2315132.1 Outer membrane protein assembly factor BamB, contains PQQ-like beta-propeller repeat [Nocardia amikacinitolerans]